MKAIVTRFHGPTNTRGSRYSARDEHFRISLSADDALSRDENHEAAARALIAKHWTYTDPNSPMINGVLPNGDECWILTERGKNATRT